MSVASSSSNAAGGYRDAEPSVRIVVVLGVIAGFLSGLFGVGGGILIVPMLVLVAGMAQRLAHGTSLAAVLPIAISGVVGFALDDGVDWAVAGALTAGAMLGAVVGTTWLHALSVRALGNLFAAVLLMSALRLVIDRSDASGRQDMSLAMIAGLIAIGLLSGILAGLLGVGGGIVMVPAMIILFGLSAAVAKGTSLAVIVPTSIVGTQRNVRRRNCDLRIALTIGLAGVVSAFVASKISLGLDEALSNWLFAILLAVVSIRTFMVNRSSSDGRPGATPAPGIRPS
jgi:uncharacterized membrane protein YfcA